MNKEKIKLGIAPIAWTNDDLPELGRENSFEQCISEMALAGYQGSEIGNKYPKDPKVLKRYLDVRNLQICNAWFSTHFTADKFDETVAEFIAHRDFLNALGAKVIGISEQGNSIQGQDVSIFANKPIYSEQQWQQVIVGFNKLADLANEVDMKLCVHHHMGTGVQTADEITYMLDNCQANVYLLFDTGHLYFSDGCQAVVEEIASKYIARIIHVHLKDIRAEVLSTAKQSDWSFLTCVKNGVFTVPGDGVISFDQVFKVLDEHSYCGWMVVEAEQDPAIANPFEYALKARAFITEKTGL